VGGKKKRRGGGYFPSGEKTEPTKVLYNSKGLLWPLKKAKEVDNLKGAGGETKANRGKR